MKPCRFPIRALKAAGGVCTLIGAGVWCASVAFAATDRPRGAEISGKFENLGPQLSARTFQSGAFTRLPEGRDILCAVVRSQPAAKVLVLDARSGALLRTLTMKGANGSWGATTASDGSVYFATESQGKLFRFVPGEETIRDLGVALAGETYLWNVTAGRDGEIFGGTYPGCRVFRYTPAGGFEEPVSGPVVPGETYARSIAFDGENRRLYVGVGVQKPHLIAIDLRTGGKAEMLRGEYPGEQSVYSLALSGDYVFGQLIPSGRAFVFGRRSGEWVAELRATGLYALASAPAPNDGKIYYVAEGRLKAFDPKQPTAPAAALAPVQSSHAFAWLKGAGEERGDWLAILTHAGQIVRYRPTDGKRVAVDIVSPAEATLLQSLATGPDGRIWMGGYLSGGGAAFDPRTDRGEQFKGLAQAEKIVSLGDVLYFGIYPRGRLYEYDVRQPWNARRENPRLIATLKGQSRPVALVAAPELGKVFIGTIPEYGTLGGMLAVWEVKTRQLTTFDDVIPNQSIASLAFARGLVIAGTTISGGLGIESKEKEGRLFLWDPATSHLVFQTTPVPGAGIVSGLTPMSDGTVWGFAQGTMFVFDLKSRVVTHTQPLFKTDYAGRAMWQEGTMVVHPSGDVYATVDGRLLRIDPRTRVVTALRETVEKKHTRPIALDASGRVYFAEGINLWRYTP
jgi:sugar lactone lactonase YvrE